MPERDFVIENGVLIKYVGTEDYVIIPEEVTAIGEEAFRNCPGVVTLENGKQRPFGSPASVFIPHTVKSIGKFAFFDCGRLTSVIFSEGLTHIGYSAFEFCSSLTEIELPSSVTDIEGSAFSCCTKLTRISLPEGLTTLRFSVFDDCTLLESVQLPQGLTHIESRAFANCESLTDVAFPQGLEAIASDAFSGCVRLKRLCFPPELKTIGDRAFNGCTGLQHVEFPQGLTHIGNCAFSLCKRLTSVELPDGLTHIGAYAFYDCLHLSHIRIPGSVVSVGERAFEMTRWRAHCGELVICDGVVLRCADVYSGLTIPPSVRMIADSAFQGLKKLTHIELPESVTIIGSEAFHGCQHLQSLVIRPGLQCIDDCAFEGCIELASVTLPESLTTIGDDAFRNCESLQEIVVPQGVTHLGDGVFAGCRQLQSAKLPDSIHSIGTRAFMSCRKLRRLQLPGCRLADLPAALKPAAVAAFFANPAAYPAESHDVCISYLSNQRKKLLIGSVEANDIIFFTACVQHHIAITPALREELIRLAGEQQQTEILAWLLNYKHQHADLQKEARIRERTEEQELSRPFMAKFLRKDWEWTRLEDGTIRIDRYKGNDLDLVIPPFVGNKPVTRIGPHLLNYKRGSRSLNNTNTSVRQVIIPEGVEVLEDYAFSRCMLLMSVILPDTLREIGRHAFSHCILLEDVSFPASLSQIGEFAFLSCRSLKQIDAPDPVRRLVEDNIADSKLLSGETIVLTPNLSLHFRQSLEDLGARIDSEISANTTLFLTRIEEDAAAQHAREAGVPVMTYSDFVQQRLHRIQY